jgi:hypothetical protein
MIYDAIIYSNDKKLIYDNYSVTFGKIIKYSEISNANHRYLTYTYFVSAKEYSREIQPDISFRECLGQIERCSKKYFLVIYSNQDKSKSLINLRDEIQSPEQLTTKRVFRYYSPHWDTIWTLNQSTLPENIKLKRFK